MSDSFLLYSSPLELFFLTFVDILPFPFRVGRFGKKIPTFYFSEILRVNDVGRRFFFLSLKLPPFASAYDESEKHRHEERRRRRTQNYTFTGKEFERK